MLVFGQVSFEAHNDGSITVGVDNGKYPVADNDVKELMNWLSWNQQTKHYGKSNMPDQVHAGAVDQYQGALAPNPVAMHPGAINRVRNY